MAKEAAKRTNEAKEQELKDFVDFQNQVENWINGTGGGSTSGDVTPPDPSTTPEQSTTKTLAETKAQEDPFEETTKVTDGKDTMTVPAGFQITEGESIDEGIVVQDRAGNEFVWVPVAKINDMVMCQTHGAYDETSNPTGGTITYVDGKFKCNKCGDEVEPTLAGKLYATSIGNCFGTPNTTFSSTGLREPDVVSSYDTGEVTLSDLQNDFYAMAKSVAENGGFYIGRYETSSLDGDEPKVISGVVPTVETDWYTMYKNSKEIAKGALTAEEKTQNKESSVTSSMIWGCQWDAVMKWMEKIKNPTITSATKYFITDSSGMGWYNDNYSNGNSDHKTGVDLKKAGSPEVVLNRVKNIYDLAGNMYEWILEASDTSYRVGRGGSYYSSGSAYSASGRYYYDPTSSGISGLSSRTTLYVNL